jgi:hypothetical protein
VRFTSKLNLAVIELPLDKTHYVCARCALPCSTSERAPSFAVPPSPAPPPSGSLRLVSPRALALSQLASYNHRRLVTAAQPHHAGLQTKRGRTASRHRAQLPPNYYPRSPFRRAVLPPVSRQKSASSSPPAPPARRTASGRSSADLGTM